MLNTYLLQALRTVYPFAVFSAALISWSINGKGGIDTFFSFGSPYFFNNQKPDLFFSPRSCLKNKALQSTGERGCENLIEENNFREINLARTHDILN